MIYRQLQKKNVLGLHPLQKQWLADVGNIPSFMQEDDRAGPRRVPPKIKDLPPIAKDRIAANVA